jgi:hypothetical protein
MWKPLKMLPASTESCSLGVEFTDASLKAAANGPGSDGGAAVCGATAKCRLTPESSE